MVLLGKTYGGLMVDVRATNAKLRARAASIVAAATGVPLADAHDLLLQAGDEVRTAIVMGATGRTPEAARARLMATKNALRAALESDEAATT
jgi:N-acetylmuramic acid 6-phosphate etherase